MSDRPRTTACFPETSMPVLARRSMTPAGVQGAKSGVDAREDKSPIL